MYYAIGHFSKFLQTGAQRVDLTSNAASNDFFDSVGFVTTDNKNVVVLDNRQATDTYTIALTDKQSGKTLTFDMEPRSFVTVVWNQ
uniref:Glycosyl hydrolase family 30 beta sandwich domain-containing protein n=2 Tax=Panagrolaimus sp. ES5 TaxID=591445 RepID=A0AC34FI29_9BILA